MKKARSAAALFEAHPGGEILDHPHTFENIA
jgi:hypothetical protein